MIVWKSKREIAVSEYLYTRRHAYVFFFSFRRDMGPDQPVYNMMCKNAGDSYLPGIIYNFRANDITVRISLHFPNVSCLVMLNSAAGLSIQVADLYCR